MISVFARLRELRQEQSEAAAESATNPSTSADPSCDANQPTPMVTGAEPPLPAAIPADSVGQSSYSLPANYVQSYNPYPYPTEGVAPAAGYAYGAPVASETPAGPAADEDGWQSMDDEDFEDEDDVEFSTSPMSRLAEIVPPGFRRTKRQVAGTVISIALHAAVLVLVANLMMPTPALNFVHEIQSWLIDPDQDEPIPEPELTLAPPDEEMSESALAAMAMSVAAVQNDDAFQEREPVLEHAPDPLIHLAPEPIEPPEGYELDDVVVHRGRVGLSRWPPVAVTESRG